MQQQIDKSIATFPGSCPHPYSKDKDGKICGNQSAYLQLKHKYGHIPFYYPSDVPSQDIEPEQKHYTDEDKDGFDKNIQLYSCL